MMRKLYIFKIIPMIGLALMGNAFFMAADLSMSGLDLQVRDGNLISQVVEPTQVPVDTSETAVPPDRVLPPVGGNAGLVLGASVLVLIIIAGVVFTSRRRGKH